MRLNYPKLSSESYNALFSLEKAVSDNAIERSILDLMRIRVSQLNGCLF